MLTIPPPMLLRFLGLIIVLSIVTGTLILWVDKPVAKFVADVDHGFRNDLIAKLPGDIRKAINFMEIFGHAVGAILVLVLVWKIDPKRRNRLPLLTACSFGVGVICLLIKLCIFRVRPYQFDFSLPIEESFCGFSLFQNFNHCTESFPSGHSILAFGLATGLSCVYPRGRVIFYLLAILVAIQRIVSGSHFTSDTFVGAALGILLAMMMICFFRRPNEYVTSTSKI